MGARTKPPPATVGCGVLGPDQLRGLARHRYRAPEGRSLTDPYLEPLWRWVMEQTPAWWAPNTMILVGLIVNGATTFLLMVFCGDATGQVKDVIQKLEFYLLPDGKSRKLFVYVKRE